MSRLRTATLTHEGGMRFVAATGSTRTIVYGDAFAENELSPVETLVVSLAACSAMDVIAIAAKKRQVIDRYAVHVEAEQRDEYPQVLTRVRVVHEVEGPGVAEAATKYGPVNAMISAGATEVHHAYRVINTGGDGLDVSGEVVVTGPYRRPDIIS